MWKKNLRTILTWRKDLWKADEDYQFQIDPQIIQQDFDDLQNLHFTEEDALEEEKAIMPFINLTKNSRVLDLGCGNGRWANILVNQCKEYVGIDFSKKFIDNAQRIIVNSNARFINMPAQNYCSDKQYDLILMIGLMTYLNDSDITKICVNCKKMLRKDGSLIVRNITLRDNEHSRMVYNCQPNFFMKVLGIPGYQIIRRNRGEDLSFFNDFHLVHEQKIENTGYTFYVLKKMIYKR